MSRTAWTGHARVTITASLPGREAGQGLAGAMAEALDRAGTGYTVTRTEGAWQGVAETGAAVSVVAENLAAAMRAVGPACRGAWGAGCEALQLEVWDRGRYEVREVTR